MFHPAAGGFGLFRRRVERFREKAARDVVAASDFLGQLSLLDSSLLDSSRLTKFGNIFDEKWHRD